MKIIFLNSVFYCCLLSFLFLSCDRPGPKGLMYCKSQELFVLEEPFNDKTAKIVIYRGDELQLTGDTVYHYQIDTNAKDSSIYYVSVTAKRGVTGWVDAKALTADKSDFRKKTVRKESTAALPKKTEVQDFIESGDYYSSDSLALLTITKDSTGENFNYSVFFIKNLDCKDTISGIISSKGKTSDKNQLKFRFSDSRIQIFGDNDSLSNGCSFYKYYLKQNQ